MKTIEIKLEQQTPLLHFDPAKGATLRATEVKPKLDKYLTKKLPKLNAFKIPDTNALNYKMQITVLDSDKLLSLQDKLPMFPKIFSDSDSKLVSFTEEPITIKLLIAGKLEDGIKSDNNKKLAKQIFFFFMKTNFGMRQTKGYGGFMVSSICIDGIPYDSEVSTWKERWTEEDCDCWYYCDNKALEEYNKALEYVEKFHKYLNLKIKSVLDEINENEIARIVSPLTAKICKVDNGKYGIEIMPNEELIEKLEEKNIPSGKLMDFIENCDDRSIVEALISAKSDRAIKFKKVELNEKKLGDIIKEIQESKK